MIEQGRLTEIKDAMEQSLAPGSCTFDHALAALVRQGRISRPDALANADSPTNLLWLLENEGTAPSPDEARAASAPPSLVSPAMASAALQKPGADPRGEPGDGASFTEFLLNV